MESVRKVPRSFELGGCTVNPEDGSLTSSGRSVRLEPLQMDLLVFLCSRAGQVVTKDEILETVWRGRFISDDTVKSTFYQLRKALNDSPRKPRYIETIPKRGYRVLIDPVPQFPCSDPAAPGLPVPLPQTCFAKERHFSLASRALPLSSKPDFISNEQLSQIPITLNQVRRWPTPTFTWLQPPLAKDRIFCRAPRHWRRVLQKTIRNCRALASRSE
jgi:DNA-binding winged helix-turn-helix (wHTH) protein